MPFPKLVLTDKNTMVSEYVHQLGKLHSKETEMRKHCISQLNRLGQNTICLKYHSSDI